MSLMYWLAVALGALALCSAAHADRPFITVTSAAAEEDDDRVWSIATAFEHARGVREFGVSAEYAFDPLHSIEWGIGRDFRGRATDADVEFKKLFNHIARDGWGWGVSLGLGAAGERGRWRGGAWSLVVPASLQVGEGVALLHANVGLVREPGERRQSLLALGIEGEAARRVWLHAEAAREGQARLLHAGARWWLQRERLALDLGATQRREEGERRRGFVVALSWYDL